jgi:serine/threonine protein kinase
LIPELDSAFQDQTEYEQELIELQMIIREYESLTQLEHPLICELLEVFIDANFIYFVNPFYTGGEVTDLLRSQDEEEINPIDEKTLKPIIY